MNHQTRLEKNVIESMYEELRQAIDDGNETMGHQDAVDEVRALRRIVEDSQKASGEHMTYTEWKRRQQLSEAMALALDEYGVKDERVIKALTSLLLHHLVPLASGSAS